MAPTTIVAPSAGAGALTTRRCVIVAGPHSGGRLPDELGAARLVTRLGGSVSVDGETVKILLA